MKEDSAEGSIAPCETKDSMFNITVSKSTEISKLSITSTDTDANIPQNSSVQDQDFSYYLGARDAGFPDEIWDMICEVLPVTDKPWTVKALANLRLSSKRFRNITEAYLYESVTVAREYDKLENLSKLSCHTELCHRVSTIVLEMEPLFRAVTRGEWNDLISHYQEASGNTNPNQLDKYFALLVRAYDTMSETERDVAWRRYQEGHASQMRLESTPREALAIIFAAAFVRCPHLDALECRANLFSVYNPGYGFITTEDTTGTLLDTLGYPDYEQQYWDGPSRLFSAVCCAAATLAFLMTVKDASKLGLLGIPASTFAQISDSIPLLPSDLQLESLTVAHFLDPDPMVGGDETVRRVISALLRRMPALHTFCYTPAEEADVGVRDDLWELQNLSEALLPEPSALAYSGRLANLELGAVKCRVQDLDQLFSLLSQSLVSLKFGHTTIWGGSWAFVFSMIRSRLTSLSSIEIVDDLLETDAYTWDIDCPHESDQDQSCLLSRLKRYLVREVDECPIPLSTADGGLRQAWEAVSDDCMYCDGRKR